LFKEPTVVIIDIKRILASEHKDGKIGGINEKI